MKNTENAIEWLSTSERATVSITQAAMKLRIRKLAVKYPDVCRIVAENADGSICAHIPAEWIRVNPSRNISEKCRELKSVCMKANRRTDKIPVNYQDI